MYNLSSLGHAFANRHPQRIGGRAPLSSWLAIAVGLHSLFFAAYPGLVANWAIPSLFIKPASALAFVALGTAFLLGSGMARTTLLSLVLTAGVVSLVVEVSSYPVHLGLLGACPADGAFYPTWRTMPVATASGFAALSLAGLAYDWMARKPLASRVLAAEGACLAAWVVVAAGILSLIEAVEATPLGASPVFPICPGVAGTLLVLALGLFSMINRSPDVERWLNEKPDGRVMAIAFLTLCIVALLASASSSLMHVFLEKSQDYHVLWSKYFTLSMASLALLGGLCGAVLLWLVRPLLAMFTVSRADLLAALDNTPTGLLKTDGMGIILHANLAAAKMFGRPAPELAGMRVTRLFTDDSATIVLQWIAAAATEEPGAIVDTRLTGVRLDGAKLPVSVSAHRYRTSYGIHCVYVMKDIAADIEREVDLQRTKALLEEAQRTTQIGDLVLDPGGGLARCSDEAARILGQEHITSTGELFAALRSTDCGHLGRMLDAAAEPGGRSVIDCSIRRVGCANRDLRFVTTRLECGDILVTVQDVTDLRRAERALRALAEKTDALREQERAYVAHELHDQLGQILTAIKLHASLPEGSGKAAVNELTDRAIGHVRDLASTMRPAALELGLAKGLEWLCQDMRTHFGIEYNLECEPVELSEQMAIQVFRIVQECLNNTVKHANAKTVGVDLAVEGDTLVLRIQDDGTGFDPQRVPCGTIGLAGIRERAKRLHGNYELITAPGQGTKHYLLIPLRDRRSGARGGERHGTADTDHHCR